MVLFRVVRPVWSLPGTQLSPVAPRSCLHATAATPWATASTGWLNLVRVADRFGTFSEFWGLPTRACEVWTSADSAEETFMVQRRERRLQQRTVECIEQDEARRTSWSSTASVSISSRLDLVLPLVTLVSDERVRSTVRNSSSL